MIYFWFVFGASIGSFLNVVIDRLPRGGSILWPASHCTNCGRTLLFWELVPIISYLFLRGRCRSCQAPIPWRYPVVEGVTAILFVAAWQMSNGDLWSLIFQLIFISLLVAIFFIDLAELMIPDYLSVSGAAVGLLYNFFRDWPQSVVNSCAGLVLAYLIMQTIGWLGKWWLKKEALGEGDVFLAAMLGAFLGWDKLLVALFVAYLAAAPVTLLLLAVKKVKWGEAVPFGPALVSGGLIALFFGQAIIDCYWLVF